MRRLVIVLLVLILLALGSPLLTGSIAQKQFDRSLANIEEMIPGLVFEQTEGDSGWYKSTNTRELVIKDWLPQDDGSVKDQRSGIFLVTEIFHGPLIFGGNDKNLPAISLGAAISRSRIRFVSADREPVEMHGGIYNRVALDGSGSLWLVFEPIAEKIAVKNDSGTATFDWRGARIDITYDSGLSHVESAGHIEPLSIVSKDGEFRIGEIKFDSTADRGEYSLWVGESSTSIAELTVSGSSSAAPQAFSLTGVTMTGGNSIDQGRLNGTTKVSISDIGINSVSGNSLDFTMSADLDAETIARLRDTITNPDVSDPQLSSQLTDAFLEAGTELVAKGLTFEISELLISTANGDAHLVLKYSVPQSELSGEAALMNAIFLMSASSKLTISRPLFDFVSQSNPLMANQMATLLQTGMLIDQGEQLTLDAVYDGGLLTINGMPIPLPMAPR